jgi:hypothetical protein
LWPAHDCPGHNFGDAEQPTKTALRRLARRHQQLSQEIAEADHDLDQLVRRSLRPCSPLPGVGPEVASQVLTSAGDPEPDPVRSRLRAPLRRRADPRSSNAPTNTGSIAAVTVAPTMRSMLSFLAASSATDAPAPTPSPARIARIARMARRPIEARDHPLPKALRRPRDLQRLLILVAENSSAHPLARP